MARYVGISYFLAITGAFFTLTYSPLKTIIGGAPKGIFPGKLGELKNGMPVNAMYVQGLTVILIIAFIAFGGDSTSKFFKVITLMTNMAMTLPYIFLALAFIPFKKKQLAGEIESPFTIFKTQASAMTWALIVTFVIGFANVFAIIEPALSSPEGMRQTITMIIGPALFTVVALILYTNYQCKMKKEASSIES